jgi:hypothetical protein
MTAAKTRRVMRCETCADSRRREMLTGSELVPHCPACDRLTYVHRRTTTERFRTSLSRADHPLRTSVQRYAGGDVDRLSLVTPS